MKSIFKKMMTALLPFLCISAHAYQIKCFSGDTVIYQGESDDVSYSKNGYYISFQDKATGNTRFIFADCMVTLSKK